MADIQLLARMYHAILSGFVHDGRAPHYTGIARELGIGAEEARRTQGELLAALSGPLAAEDGRLVSLGGAHWALPGTDYIASFSPFANVATQYRVSVDGHQKWYGQCGLESLAISWLSRGKEVRIDAHCLDCAEPLTVRMRGDEVLEVTPPTAGSRWTTRRHRHDRPSSKPLQRPGARAARSGCRAPALGSAPCHWRRHGE